MELNEVTIDGVTIKFRPVYYLGYIGGYYVYAKDRPERYYAKGRYPECWGVGGDVSWDGFDKRRFMRTAAQDYLNTLKLEQYD